MNFLNNKKNLVTLLILIALSFSFIKCASEAQRHGLLPGVGLDPGSPMDDNNTAQITTLTDIINNSDPSKSHIAKQVFIKQTIERIVTDGVSVLDLPIEELPWEIAEEFFTEIGSAPHPAFTQMNRVHVYSNESVNGIRYLNAGFNVMEDVDGLSGIAEAHISFEVEKFDGNFQTTIDFLKESLLGENSEPCLDTLQDHTIFKTDDLVVEIFRETEDSIDLNSAYPPRTLDDVGVVRVSISKGSYHGIADECLPEGHSHEGHDH